MRCEPAVADTGVTLQQLEACRVFSSGQIPGVFLSEVFRSTTKGRRVGSMLGQLGKGKRKSVN